MPHHRAAVPPILNEKNGIIQNAVVCSTDFFIEKRQDFTLKKSVRQVQANIVLGGAYTSSPIYTLKPMKF